MSEIGLRSRMLVKDVMSSPVITLHEDETVEKVAKLMEAHRVGCVIITDGGGKPVGIITERDLVTRVMAKNELPSGLNANQVMTSPLVTISPDETLSGAARRMSRLNVRRLGVFYKDNLVGVVSSKDVLAVTPELLETIQEKVRLESGNMTEVVEIPSTAGYCERCREWASMLVEEDGEFLCEECRSQNQITY